MARYAVRRLDEVPTVPASDLLWYPLQHHFGLAAFGANVFVAAASGDVLVEEHDERSSGQEELYVVVRGSVSAFLDAEEHEAAALALIAVPDPAVTRELVALEAKTTILAVGARPGSWTSTWRPSWFEDVPQA